MKAIAKGVCGALESLGADCDWRATQAVLICIIAIAAVLFLSWLGLRKRWPRLLLDSIYGMSGILAALFMLAMLGVIVAQMVARWSGMAFPGSTDYAGYCMAGASFFALAYALNRGSHIRVNLMLTALGRHRRWGEIWCLAIAALLATYFARYAIKATILSEKLNDISQGQDATPIWIPQLSMCIGTILLAAALWDNLFRMIFAGTTNIIEETVEEAPIQGEF